MGGNFKRRLIDPFLLPIIFAAVIATIVITVGETLLTLFIPGDTPDRLNRPELYFALALATLVIFGLAYLASRPEGTLGRFDREVAIGRRPIFDESRPQADAAVRLGSRGTVDDIEEGFTLYAGNGEIATVRGLLPGSVDAGKQFRGFIYAEGLYGVSDELWIPIEAVMTVYPESRSVFLAIKGDELEHFGWHVPPESMRRVPARSASHL